MKLAKTYEPDQYEANIYAMWETSGVFDPKGEGEPYCIIMPPPNANGDLHVGHALAVSLEDTLVRYHRMKGKDAIYIPGSDHAGFETWVVYERELKKQGKSRFDFSREQVYSQVWNFVDSKRGNMELQLRALGVSASWNNLVFTLDEKVIRTVYGNFKKLWDEGLIYRGERIVNYSTKYQTSYADIEVEHKMEKGTLWEIAYPLLDKIGEVVVATTRPETMFGDTAIAVNPSDSRYKDLIGMRVQLPLSEREIPIIADEYVDPNYGTGVVKITPAHDPNDFEVGNRHNLPRIQVIDFDGTMINVPDQFSGLNSTDARKRVLAALSAGDFIRGEKTIEHSVGYDYKSGLPIEPLIKEQWFLKVRPLAYRAKQAIENGEVSFYPASKKAALIQYYDNLRDWNLSRQIPWGIPIPAFQNVNDPNDWIYDDRVDEKLIVVNGTTYRREEDTFDTWFSSGQWPFITTDYLDNGGLARFYPTSVLETGHDILYPWVARMIMLGLHFTDKVPFRDVYLHGLVLDEKGQKMSKSKGNVVNPMELVADYGSDAMRLGIMASRSAGQNQAFNASKVIAGRNFTNKLWNMARYIEDKLSDSYKPGLPEPQTPADHWVVSKLISAATSIGQKLESYRFAEASDDLYHVVWDAVADWYIEVSKLKYSPDILAWVLDTCLKIAHPFAPFVSETIWQTLSWHDDLLIAADWPEAIKFDQTKASQFDKLQKLISEIRYVAAELPGNKKYSLLHRENKLIADNLELIKKLAKLDNIESIEEPRGLHLIVDEIEAWLDIDNEMLAKYKDNLVTKLAETRQFIIKLEKRLSSDNYLSKAPSDLVEQSRLQLASQRELAEHLSDQIELII